jgi:two-component system sensor histidine kinase UhpB
MNPELNPDSISISREEYTRLKYTEEFFHAIFEESPFILVINDAENEQYINGNHFFCEMNGRTKEEIVGKTAVELGFSTEPESHEEMLRLFRRDGCINSLERTYKAGNGQVLDFLIWTKIIGIEGKKYAFTTMQDITESNTRKNELIASESKYRGLYMQMLDAFIRTDMDGTIIEANEAFLTLTGYTMPELNKMNFRDLTPLSFLVVEQDILESQILKRGYSDLYQKEYIRKNGAVVPVELRTHLEVDKQGRPVSMWAIIRDISIRQKAFAELKESQAQLRALASHIQNVREEEKISIAREIHDELGHLLTAVKLDLEEIGVSPATANNIQEKLNPIISLVDSCIDTARKISFDLHPGILDHFGLIPALEWMIDQFSIRTKIKCRFSLPKILPEFNKTESTVVFRIFQEIFTNITRHSKASKIDIILSQSVGNILFMITDNGIGFDTGTSMKNASLGLLSMKERALSIGAGFSIASEPGKGTTIKLQITQPVTDIKTS